MTDGFRPYVGAVEEIFGADIDFAQLVKLYSSDEETRERYSPGEVVETIAVLRRFPELTRLCHQI
jgi:hypothetical protein